MSILVQVLLLVLGFVMLVKGADWFVEGASKLAEKFGIPQLVIGLTIVAMGTSLPETAVSVSAAIKGSAEIRHLQDRCGKNLWKTSFLSGWRRCVRHPEAFWGAFPVTDSRTLPLRWAGS